MAEIKAKLEVTKTPNGAKQVTFHYEKNGKPKKLILSQTTEKEKVDFSLNGKDCIYENDGSKIVKLTVDGQEIFNIKGQGAIVKQPITVPGKDFPGGGKKAEEPVGSANAPYNFIPLNTKIVPSEHGKWEKIPGFEKYQEGTLSGTIELKIKTQTPMYIRDAKTTSMEETAQPPSFFAPDGTPKIPGSSLKGLIRSMVEITSYSKFSFVDDKNLYFRNIGDEFYKNEMIKNEQGKTYNLAKSGILKEENGDYYLYPSKIINKTQYYRVDYKNNNRELLETHNIRPAEFSFQTVYFQPTEPERQLARHPKIKPQYALYYALVTKVAETPRPNFVKGYLVSSGNFSTKKHMHWIINEPTDQKKPIPKNVMENYEKDEQRVEKSDLLQMLKNHSEGVPCFYLEKEGKIKAVGHTGLFRLPYDKTIEDHIPNKADDTLDMTEAIFGDTEHIASRVAFEDANFVGDKNNCFEQTTSPKILSSPKPTTFQHYLEQPEGLKTPKNKLNHWNRNTPIRGHKLYWHKENASWSEGKIINDTQHTIITPIKKGATFEGLIRFENLTEVELGALLFTLELKENLCHKIGMAKPLGLGSIKIKPTLKLIDRQSEKGRYTSLFSTDQWHTAQNTEKDHKQYVQKFEKYICEQLGKKDASLWETERMQELKEMLDWEKTSIPGWNNKTDYLQLAEFKNRSVLPRPSEVK